MRPGTGHWNGATGGRSGWRDAGGHIHHRSPAYRFEYRMILCRCHGRLCCTAGRACYSGAHDAIRPARPGAPDLSGRRRAERRRARRPADGRTARGQAGSGLRRHWRPAHGGAGAAPAIPDAGAGRDGPAGGAAARFASAPPAAPRGGGCGDAAPGRAGDHRQPRLHPAHAEAAEGGRAAPGALRGPAGLGVARASGAGVSRPVGQDAGAAAVRGGVFRPPRPAQRIRRPSRAGIRRRYRRRRPFSRRPMAWRPMRRCWC